MKVIMTGGGTGGHIYPAIAIADKIKKENPDAEILFVGTERGLEKTLVPQNGYPIRFIKVRGFDRKNLLKNFQTVKEFAEGSHMAKKIIQEFQPDMVIGTGGYVCGPVVRMAAKLGIKTYIHEQNAFPGMTNKLLEKYVKKVFISFPEAEKYFKEPEKMVLSGNPVRESFFHGSRSEARKKLGIPEDCFMVLASGGSRGALRINESMIDVADFLAGHDEVELYMATGSVFYEQAKAVLAKHIAQSEAPTAADSQATAVSAAEGSGAKTRSNIHLMEYIKNMDDYLKAADVVIGRSGALTVSEITVCGRASILIPSPNVTGNHQYFNAKAVADKGGAILIEEKDLTDELLLESIMKLKKNRTLLAEMEEAAKKAAPGRACDIIYENI